MRAATFRNSGLTPSLLRARDPEYKAQLVSTFGRHVLSGFTDGSLRTVVDSVFPLKVEMEAMAVFKTFFRKSGLLTRRWRPTRTSGRLSSKFELNLNTFFTE